MRAQAVFVVLLLALIPSDPALAVWPPFHESRSPIIGGDPANLRLPEGTIVVYPEPIDGLICSSDGLACFRGGFYWGPTREVVMEQGASFWQIQHELCHAHQHWTINEGEDLLFDPDDPVNGGEVGLLQWEQTEESVSYAQAIMGLPPIVSHPFPSVLEDFASACAYWYTDPEYLYKVSPERYAWMQGKPGYLKGWDLIIIVDPAPPVMPPVCHLSTSVWPPFRCSEDQGGG